MNKEEAIKEMEKMPRSIVKVSFARKICEAFDLELPERFIMREGWMKRHRAMGDDSQAGVGMDDIAVHIAGSKTGRVVPSSPYIGTGKSAEHQTLESVRLLKRHYKKKKVRK